MGEILSDIQAVDWSQYDTAYGAASNVPGLLEALAGPDVEAAKAASHDLWCGLCHQHAYVSSAALPSYPILVRIIGTAHWRVVVEILDILLGFARCTSPEYFPGAQLPKWTEALRAQMQGDRAMFEGLCANGNEDIRDFATGIVDALDGVF